LPVHNTEAQPACKLGSVPVSEIGLGYKLEPKPVFKLEELPICMLQTLLIYNSVSVIVCKLEQVHVCI